VSWVYYRLNLGVVNLKLTPVTLFFPLRRTFIRNEPKNNPQNNKGDKAPEDQNEQKVQGSSIVTDKVHPKFILELVKFGAVNYNVVVHGELYFNLFQSQESVETFLTKFFLVNRSRGRQFSRFHRGFLPTLAGSDRYSDQLGRIEKVRKFHGVL
jgi:hypothetical protein